MTGGHTGGEYDPEGDYESPGSEIVYVVVSEAQGSEGPADWYVLGVTLK